MCLQRFGERELSMPLCACSIVYDTLSQTVKALHTLAAWTPLQTRSANTCLQTHMERDFILSELDADSGRSRLEELMHPEYEMPWEEGTEQLAAVQEEYEPISAGKFQAV